MKLTIEIISRREQVNSIALNYAKKGI